jgi:hypothetical protein
MITKEQLLKDIEQSAKYAAQQARIECYRDWRDKTEDSDLYNVLNDIWGQEVLKGAELCLSDDFGDRDIDCEK